jgi:class 3 adenylate cyclase/tetratricopeptide (TPR) repeat protein/tRNA A37 threonylcarbamoyladenosine biosynthesis protein TsaE
MDVGGWLRSLGLGKYEAAFRENEIDETVLPSLTHEILKELGVTAIGHRLKLLDAIAALRAEASEPAPLSDAALETDKAAKDTAERRQVTVMFSDLVGSTALSARLDPEDLREIIAAYQRCVAETVHSFDGFVAKYMGDGVLIYFGYPAAHEDDAERAVRAGLALIDAVATLPTPEPVQVRIGVATGMVVVGDLVGSGEAQERGIVGETPNLAARLQGVAEPNTVVIAEATRRLLGNLFELRDLGPKQLKGIAGPARAFAALQASSVESRFEAMHAGGLTALVGREEELELLLRRWAKARTGEGQVVLLSGEAGIGKSRLSAALMEALTAEPHTRLRYFCSPQHTDSAFYPLIGQFERAAGFAHGDTMRTKLDKLDALLDQTSTSRQDAVVLAEMLSLPNDGRYPALDLAPEQRRQKTLEALGAQLATLARSSPVLMILEDAHWGDPTSLEAFGRTVDQIASFRVLLIVTFRPEFEAPWVGQPHVTALALNRLGHREVNTLIERVVGNKPLPADIRKDIIERTDGIPLFVEEMTKAVVEAGGELEAMQIAASVPSSAHAVPASLHASLMARLDRLGPAKEVAQIGAAISREFSHALLAVVVRKPEAELASSLDRLIRAGLLFRKGVPPHATYLFKHALVQDVAYASLLKSRRSELHGRIAAVLEARFADLVARQPELLAYHLTAAGLADRAIDLWLQAGQLAAGRSANREAINHLTTALEMLANRPATDEQLRRELEVQIALGPPLTATRGFAAPEVAMAHTRAEHLARRYGHRRHLARALRGLCYVNHVRGHILRTSELGSELVDLAEQGDDLVMQADAHNALAFNLFHQGEHRPAREHLEISNAKILHAGDPANALSRGVNIHVFARAYQAHVDWHLGFADAALRAALDAINLAHRLVHPFSMAVAFAYAAMLHQFRREPTEVRARADAAHSICTEHGFSYYAAWAAIMNGWAIAEEGDVEVGIARVRVGVRDLRATGAELRLPHYLGILADIYRRAQQLQDATVTLVEARAVAERNAEHWADPSLHLLASDLALAIGDQAEAERCLRRAMENARAQDARALLLRAGTRLARLLAAGVRRAEAYDELAKIYASLTEGLETVDSREARAVLDGQRSCDGRTFGGS